MSTPNTLESFTLLSLPTQGSCGCGCGCDEEFSLTQLVLPQPGAVPAGEAENVRPQENRTGHVTRR
jgi:hypothetical protein